MIDFPASCDRRVGLGDPWSPWAQQRAFRGLMQAFSYPGRCVAHEFSGEAALMGVLATLLDGETTLADPDGLVSPDAWRRLQARRETPATARFVVARGDHPPVFTPALGTLESPELGATVILWGVSLDEGRAYPVSGPGVDGVRACRLDGIDAAWLAEREIWNAAFPLGVDCLLVSDSALLALPRTTCIAEGKTA